MKINEQTAILENEDVVLAETNVEPEMPKQKKMLTRRAKRAIFYILLMILPMIQWVTMYIGVHTNTITLAFQKYLPETASLGFAGFENFKHAWDYIFAPGREYLWKNSLIFIFLSVCIKQTFTLFFSYYIYKKFPLAGLFKVMLFLPGIVSSLVYSWSFKVVIDELLPSLGVENSGGFMGGSAYGIVVFYNLWLGFGTQMLIYSSGMSAIDESMVEASHIDGASLMKEFWYITIPCVSKTILTFLITGLTLFFSNSLGLYDFYGYAAGKSATLGYQVYIDTLRADYTRDFNLASNDGISYMVLAAIGLLESLFLIPVVLFMRWFINKIIPNAD